MGKKLVLWLDKNLERYIMAFLMAVIVCMMTIDVLSRYVFSHGLAFPQEIARYSMLYITFLGIAYGVKYNAHLRVDILPALIPKFKPIYEMFGDAVMIIFGALLTYAGIGKLQSLIVSQQYSTALHLPMWIVYLGLEIGWILTLIRFAEKYGLKIYYKVKHLEPPQEEEHAIDMDVPV